MCWCVWLLFENEIVKQHHWKILLHDELFQTLTFNLKRIDVGRYGIKSGEGSGQKSR